MRIVSKTGQGGFSLVELMVGLVIGLIVMAAVLSLFMIYNRSNIDTMRALRLEQDVRSTLDFIKQDVRRAGFWHDADVELGQDDYRNALENLFDTHGSPIRFSSSGSDCTGIDDEDGHTRIEYSYDADLDGDFSTFQIRLSNGAIQFHDDTTWHDLTDRNAITYTNLCFTEETLNADGVTNIRVIGILLSAQVANNDKIQRTVHAIVRVRNDEYLSSQ